MIRSIARVPTDKGSRYLQQLCKHWSHNLAVEFTPEAGTVVFPTQCARRRLAGRRHADLQAHDGSLECRLEASADEQLEALKGVVARHLDRFAHREAPLRFDWQNA